MTNLPAASVSNAARPVPVAAARSPDTTINDLRQGQETEGLFREELTREIGALNAQTRATPEARQGAAPAHTLQDKDAPGDTAGPESAADASFAATLSGAILLPAILVDAKPLPAATAGGLCDPIATTPVLSPVSVSFPVLASASIPELQSASVPASAPASASASIPVSAPAVVDLAAAMASAGNMGGARPDYPAQGTADSTRSGRASVLATAGTAEPVPAEPLTGSKLAPGADPAESAVAGKVLPAGWEKFESGAAPDPGIKQHTAEAPLATGLNAAPAAPTHVTSSASATIGVPVAAPGWDRGLGEKMVWMAGRQLQVAELHLNPPELGPLQITLTINNDQASAQFVSQHAAVREAIEAAMPRLREMLAGGGIALGNTSVSAESFGGQAQARQDSGGHLPRNALQADASDAFRVAPLRRATHGLVDIFA